MKEHFKKVILFRYIYRLVSLILIYCIFFPPKESDQEIEPSIHSLMTLKRVLPIERYNCKQQPAWTKQRKTDWGGTIELSVPLKTRAVIQFVRK